MKQLQLILFNVFFLYCAVTSTETWLEGAGLLRH